MESSLTNHGSKAHQLSLGPRRILFLTQYDENGASSRIRIYQFIPFFEQAGYHCDVRPLITGDVSQVWKGLTPDTRFIDFLKVVITIIITFRRRIRDVIAGWSYDAVVVQKDVMPFGLGRLLALGQRNIIFEFDDPIWQTHDSGGGKFFLGKLMGEYRKRLLIAMLKRSKMVIVDNDILKNFSQAFCHKVITITSPIDTQKYTITRIEEPKAIPSFGWIGSPGTSHLLESLIPALEILGEKIKFRLYNIGGLALKAKNFEIQNIK